MTPALRVGGFVPLTTLDYPGLLACVLFCQGCAWRCRYCHNPALITPRGEEEIEWEEIMAFLQRRQGLLQGVVFSGGEASLQPGLPAAIESVRELGFKVGLHSAGIKPDALARVLPMVDWVGFDVKSLEEQVELITGVSGSGRANWQSLDLLLGSGVAYECRTTVHWQLFDCDRLWRLAQRLSALGVQHFVVQLARNAQVLDATLLPSPIPAQAEALWTRLQGLFPRFELRSG